MATLQLIEEFLNTLDKRTFSRHGQIHVAADHLTSPGALSEWLAAHDLIPNGAVPGDLASDAAALDRDDAGPDGPVPDWVEGGSAPFQVLVGVASAQVEGNVAPAQADRGEEGASPAQAGRSDEGASPGRAGRSEEGASPGRAGRSDEGGRADWVFGGAVSRLGGLASGEGVLGQADLEAAVGLREALRRTLTDDTAALADYPLRLWPDGSGGLRLAADTGRSWLDTIVETVANSAARGDWKRLKLCAAPDCHWAFHDTSRNGRGRWCDMDVCGNRHKTRTYRERHASQ